MNSVPSERTPINAPTVTNDTVDVATTRVPATITGVASGNSTSTKRRGSEYPHAFAACRVARGIVRKPSATWRTNTATP